MTFTVTEPGTTDGQPYRHGSPALRSAYRLARWLRRNGRGCLARVHETEDGFVVALTHTGACCPREESP